MPKFFVGAFPLDIKELDLAMLINEEPEPSENSSEEIESHRQSVYQKLTKPGEVLKKKRPRRL